jgi:hypothetical protein
MTKTKGRPKAVFVVESIRRVLGLRKIWLRSILRIVFGKVFVNPFPPVMATQDQTVH